MRVLTVTQLFYPDTVGGSERVVYEQCRGLVRRGHQVTVVVQRARLDLPDEETIDGIHIIRYGTARRRYFFGISHTDLTVGYRVLRSLLAEQQFDVAAVHHPTPAFAFFRALGQRRLPTLYVFHASVYRELLHVKKEKKRPVTQSIFGMLVGVFATPILLRRLRHIEGTAISKADALVVLSEFSRHVVQETYHVADASLVKIPGGVDIETFVPKNNTRVLRQRLSLPQDRMVFLTVRRLVPRMGIEELLYGFAEVLKRRTDVQLIIGGIGPERDRLRAVVRKLGINHFVTFLGFIHPRDLPDYYAASDLFVLPSVAFEGFGIATLEALACGTPVLGTPIGASPELLRAFDPSLMSDDATPEALARGMLQFLSRTAEDRFALRRRARALAETTYPWSRSIDLLENTLFRVASAPSAMMHYENSSRQ